MAELVQRLAPRFSIDPRLALAIVRSESNFEAQALSPRNAQGLMQLIPETAERFGVRDAWNPEQNVRGGLAYLRWLLERFGGDVALASAAYNAGPGRARRWRDSRPLEGAVYAETIPFNETRDYVKKVMANTMYYSQLIGGKLVPLKERLGLIPARSSGERVNEELP